MAVEGPRLDLGYLLSTADYRNSTLSGTTHMGNLGSAQFSFMHISTVGTLTAGLTTVAGAVSHGVLQNKPNAGEACDIAIFGVSKVIAGTTTITAGSRVMSDSSGAATPLTTGLYPVAVALETPTAVGQIFSAALFGFGGAFAST